MLNTVFYLYGSAEAAKRGDNTGGTGFFVRIPFDSDPKEVFTYAVTNKHVACTGASVIRVNCFDGEPDIFDIGPEDWTAHPDGDDLAACQLVISPRHKATTIPSSMFATAAGFNNRDYGLGDSTFMIGRFVAHDGKETNVPTVGFGNISMPPSLMQHESGHGQLSFGVEMRSMKGSSGSPVFSYTDGWDMAKGTHAIGSNQVCFLGVDWGQVVHPIEVKEYIVPVEQFGIRANEREARVIRINTGMNGVIPAWKVLELLNIPAWKEGRSTYERDYIAKHKLQRRASGNSIAQDLDKTSGT